MTNLLSRFNQDVVGSQSKYADYISTVAPAGDFRRIKSLDVILNSWSNILVTPTRSYLFDPEYGSDSYKLVFEPADSRTVQRIKAEVKDKLVRYDDRAAITKIDVTYLNNLKGFTVNVQVSFEGSEGEISVTLDENIYFKFFESTGSG